MCWPQAANGDVDGFWEASRASGRLGAIVTELTGREVAKSVKTAGRGSHVDWKYEGCEADKMSGEGGRPAGLGA